MSQKTVCRPNTVNTAISSTSMNRYVPNTGRPSAMVCVMWARYSTNDGRSAWSWQRPQVRGRLSGQVVARESSEWKMRWPVWQSSQRAAR